MAEQEDLVDPSIFSKSGAPSGVSSDGSAQDKSDLIDPSVFEPNKKPPKPTAPTDPYEAKVQALAPRAKEEIEKGGYTRAAEAASTGVPILGPVVGAVARGTKAAYKAATGEGSFKENYENLSAEDEALRRAANEQYPKTSIATEIGGSLLIPFGEVAGPAEAVAARYLPSLASKAIGMGAEGAAIGAASAEAKNILGTQPESEKSDVGTEAAVSGAFGAALPVAGKAISKITPDWLKDYAGKLAGSDSQMKQFLQRIAQDEAAGEDVLGVKGALEAISNGQPINPFNMGGTKTQQWLLKAFKGRGDALDNFTNTLQQKMAGAGDRFDQMLRETAGVTDEFDLDKLSKESKAYAQKLNDANYQKAAWLPDNGVGTWNERWEPQMKDKYVLQAIDEVNGLMSDIKQAPFESPINRLGVKGVDTLGLNKDIAAAFKGAGINTLDDVKGAKTIDLVKALHPEYEDSLRKTLTDHLAQGFEDNSINKERMRKIVEGMSMDSLNKLLKSNNLQMPKEVRAAMSMANNAKKLVNMQDLDKITLVKPENLNVEYLDRLQRKLGSNAKALIDQDPSQNMVLGTRLRKLQDDIVGSMKGQFDVENRVNPYHNPNTYNAAFDQAHTQARLFHRANGAFDMGRTFLNQLNDNLNASKIANAIPKMTDPNERNMFVQGILAQMKTKGVENGAMKYKLVNKWFSDPYITKSLETALGPQAFGKMKAFVRAEAIMNESLQRARQIEGAGRGSNILGIINKDAISYGVSYLLDSHLPLLGFVYNHVINPYMGVKYATRLRSMLESGDLNQMADAYDAIMRNPNARNALLDGLNGMFAANVGNQPRAEGGRVKRATGGRVPEMDKLFKSAKKVLDNETKPMLGLHDDVIVNALRIAQGRV